MDAIKLKEYITGDELVISPEKLAKFRNMNVEIIILPLDDKVPDESYMKFAGTINDEDAVAMQQSLDDCRRIDESEWI